MATLTHFDKNGAATMVDFSDKADTERVAVATTAISMKPETFELALSGHAKKGDVLGVARLAGIMAAKKTSDLIPLCHPLPISRVAIDFEPSAEASKIVITSTVKTTGKTGVEMEALTAASIAALSIYDMLKAVDRGMVISDTKILLKDGGKSGRYEGKF